MSTKEYIMGIERKIDHDESVALNDEHVVEQSSDDERSGIEKKIDHFISHGKYISDLKNLKRFLMYSLLLNAMLLLLLLFGVITMSTLYSGRNVSVVIPPGMYANKNFTFTNDRANRSAYLVFADYISRAFGNVNFDTVRTVYDDLVDYTDPDKRYYFRSKLDYDADQIESNVMTRHFKLSNIELLNKGDSVVALCYGYMSLSVGSQPQYEKVPYVIRIVLRSYRANIMIQSINGGANRNVTKLKDKRSLKQFEKDTQFINM